MAFILIKVIFGILIIPISIKLFKVILQFIFGTIKRIIWLLVYLIVFGLYFVYGKIIILILIAIIILQIYHLIKTIKKHKEERLSDYDYSTSYVLNKKTGVIHEQGSYSASTIKDNHKKNISSSKADELVGRGTRYRYKK